MFYQVFEWHRQAMMPFVDAARVCARPAELLLPLQVAVSDLATRLVNALEPVPDDLPAFVQPDVQGPFAAKALATSPFATTWWLRSGRADRPPAVLVPPCSGYVAGVASPLISALLRRRPVIAIDWQDARRVPTACGRFGLAEQVAAVERAIAEAGPGAIVVGLSQSVVATVAGAALAAAAGRRPAALVLLAGPLDTRNGQHVLTTFLRLQPLILMEAQFTTLVPHRYPGRGRRVYPGLLQLLAYAMGNPHLYLQAQHGLIAELTAGEPAGFAREHRDLHSLMDVPAELFLDTVAVAFKQHSLVQGRLAFGGRRVELSALQGIQLLTVEGTADELVGVGHTHGAVDLLPHAGARRVTVEGARHHEMFTGARFAEAVVPHLDDLLEAA